MKEIVKSLAYILVFGVFLAVTYLYIPTTVSSLNRSIYQTGSQTPELFTKYNQVMSRNLPEKTPPLYFYWWSNQRKISDLRVKEALAEIQNSKVETGIKVWSLLNMGVVIKTPNHTIAIDTANVPFSTAHYPLTNIADLFLVTHADGDHFDGVLLKKAMSQNKKVAYLEGMYPLGNQSENIILKSNETKNIDGVKITAFQTDHRGNRNFNEAGSWLLIEVDGYKLLHTGDGREFKNKTEQQIVYATRNLDILLANYAIHPFNIRDLNPKVLIPLHLFKFMSGHDIYQESTYEKISANYNKYAKDLAGINIIYLLPGENFTYLNQ